MTEGTTDEAKLIDAIKANAREFFPNGECTVHHDDTDDRWVLLVIHPRAMDALRGDVGSPWAM